LILPAIKAEAAHLRTPDAIEREEGDRSKRAELEARRLRVIDMFEAGVISRDEMLRRIRAAALALAALDTRAQMVAVPQIDWDWRQPR